METERLIRCNGIRFGINSEKPKHIGFKELRNEIHTAWDNLIQGV
jgi:hypothetical protein